MPRPVSTAFRRAVNARETGECFLLFLTLRHPSLASPIRVVNDGVDHTVGTDVYLRFPFQITLASDSRDTTPRGQLEICNVDREIVAALRRASGPPIEVEVFLAMASSPSVIEAGPLSFTLRDTTYDAMTVSGTLVVQDIRNKKYPPRVFDPSVAPGLF